MERVPELAVQLWFESIGRPEFNLDLSPNGNSRFKYDNRNRFRRDRWDVIGRLLGANRTVSIQLELTKANPAIGGRAQRNLDVFLDKMGGGSPGQQTILAQLGQIYGGLGGILQKFEILSPAA